MSKKKEKVPHMLRILSRDYWKPDEGQSNMMDGSIVVVKMQLLILS